MKILNFGKNKVCKVIASWQANRMLLDESFMLLNFSTAARNCRAAFRIFISTPAATI
jgi:hypothetical protein